MIAVDGGGAATVGSFIDVIAPPIDGDGQEDSMEPGGREATWQVSPDGTPGIWTDFLGPIQDDIANPGFSTIEITPELVAAGPFVRVVYSYTDDLGTAENAESNAIQVSG